MAEPARSAADAPSGDPAAIQREVLLQRARRRARIERRREQRLAHLRFWFVVVALLSLSVVLTIWVWREVERLFGL